MLLVLLVLVVALPPLAHLGRPVDDDAAAAKIPTDDDAARKRFNDMLNIPAPSTD